ncbi:HigA family addiction module antidote protein [Pseudoalteromonas sp. A41-2]|uniref:HigA family addiction module antitoxin n=1 Tax=unclassified Pseudoalteromonas TaxID=194690 RepID=UPI0018CA3E7A|nr:MULTISPECIES: HigA family addiction module antitoxin [unclassified Pseudoalteromonas]MCC9660709.1 HigA family addiction module antitoxin [Pseudoalteromonas sp. MB41]QPL43049.1 HigA family addiction module antidote protein [Pseudoalteromonas sp. A41-2]
MRKTTRQPSSVGEIIQQEFLIPSGVTVEMLSVMMDVDHQTVAELINGAKLSELLANKLAKYFGTSREFWLDIQTAHDNWQASQVTHPNPFKENKLDNPGVDATTSRIRSQRKLKSIIESEGGYIVDIPDDKRMLHPARYFETLFLHKLKARELNNNDLSKRLDLSVEQFNDFLKEKISVTLTLAKRLEEITGMRCEFWIRVQSKFDNSH